MYMQDCSVQGMYMYSRLLIMQIMQGCGTVVIKINLAEMAG